MINPDNLSLALSINGERVSGTGTEAGATTLAIHGEGGEHREPGEVLSLPLRRSAGLRAGPEGEHGGPPAWAARYIGIPFKSRGRDRTGCDCYGLLALVMREQFGRAVPSYDGAYDDAFDREEIAALIRAELFVRWCRVTDLFPGDAIVFTIAGRAWHVGVVAARPWFLHVRPRTDSCLERWDAIRWRRRVEGFYRYVG